MSLYSSGRARRSLFHTIVFRGLSQIATITGYVIMVRAMSEHDFGVLHLMYAVIPLISAGASFGLEHVLRRYEPGFLAHERTFAARCLVRFVGRARFGSNLVVLAVIFSAWHVVAPIVKLEPYREPFILFSVLILLFFQVRVLELSFASRMLHKYSVGMQAATALMKFAGYGSFALLGDLSLYNAILTDTIAYGVTYAVVFIVHRRVSEPAAGSDAAPIRKDEIKRMVRYGTFYNFNDVGTVPLSSKADHFFIAALLDPVAVGVYAFYIRLSDMAMRLLPIKVFQNVIQPVFFSKDQEASREKIPDYFTLLLNTTLAIQVPLTVFTLVFHREIVLFAFGDKFVADSWLLPIVMAFSVVNSASTAVTLVAQYAERAGIILLSKVFGIYNIAALLILIPPFGVYGAAIATGSAAAMKNLFIWWHVRRLAVWRNWRAFSRASLTCWIVFALVAGGLVASVAWQPLPLLALGLALWAITQLLYLRGNALTDTDRQMLGKLMSVKDGRVLRTLRIT
jgi:O-antigen/teichoic acid export membrane protein